ncbi:ABC transporter permease [Anaerocolumna cellulosilytica]|uniref:ABC transporter permease n=1 Tax=Anaerocolumna cellulosilytica TaxID=433286 RepID=A0A6S6QZY4_9FIRM|nr:ABC transporter permease [Anaerocolumna cellulosilytica]MBB5195740.1 simple sugar transport system permease protein [Anaerocolumna cellulosilytica]BCJ92925.1 ABC transporter permease [Anaerocolumna cellulosilytica]
MKKKVNFFSSKGSNSFLSAIMAIAAGLLFGLVILLISNAKEAFPAFVMILKGGFASGLAGLGQVLYLATPIILTGLSVGFAFKTGLFNIGSSGQFTCGAFAAVYIGVKWTFLPGGIHWIVALLGAALVGALWGIVPGVLKAIANVNEVITSIMMNYIGMYLINILIVKFVHDPIKNQSVPVAPTAIIPKAGLDKLFGTNNMNISVFIAILMVVLIYIVLNKTTFGYELKACGLSPDASKYAGINAKRNIVLSMVIAGALSGFGGGLLYLAGSGKYLQVLDVLAPQGFNGISVALLGMSNPIGILFSGLFIAHITVGGSNTQLYNFVPEVIDIIIAAIIYCGAFALLFKNLIARFGKKSSGATKEEG